jgi:hypothetical protein
MLGGGMDVSLSRRIAIRAFDCDWLAFLTDNAVATAILQKAKTEQ